MKVIGITGGVGSGKSEVLKFLEQEYGAVVCQMDEVAKQIQKKGTQRFRESYRNLVNRLSETMVNWIA